MKDIKQKDQPQHLQELSGQPGSDSVSRVAKGEQPENQEEETIRTANEIYERRYGESMEAKDAQPHEIQEAYANLFESLSRILRA